MTIWRGLSATAGVEIEPELADLRPGELAAQLPRHLARRDELGWSPKVGIDEGLAMTYRALSEEFAAG